MSGELVVVSTPIGNLDDLSPRAAAALGAADIVCCEDTRHTGMMLKRLGIEASRLLSLHAHNEAERVPALLAELASGSRVAVVSDAGMPAVSDPGALLVSAAIEAGIKVTAVPGPSAVTTAVALAGMGGARWSFEGFLPRKGRQRRERLEQIAGARAPTVLFESPRRVAATLADLAESCGPARRVAVLRELTKLHEEVWRSTLSEAVARLGPREPRGEFVLVVDAAGATVPEPPAEADVRKEVESRVDEGQSRRDAVRAVAERRGIPRHRVYEVAVGRPPKGQRPGEK